MENLHEQYDEFMHGSAGTMGTTRPEMTVIGRAVKHKPLINIGVNREQAKEDERTVKYYLCLTLFIADPENTDDNVIVDLTLNSNLQDAMFLFKEDVVPVRVLMDEPSTQCVEAIISHAVARKANYTVTVTDERHNNEVRFSVDLGKGQIFDGLIGRDRVCKYFQWEPAVHGVAT